MANTNTCDNNNEKTVHALRILLGGFICLFSFFRVLIVPACLYGV